MGSHYVFEISLKNGTKNQPQTKANSTECQFATFDGRAMENFSSFIRDVGKLTSEPFSVRYIDDEEDVIAIDSEEEFNEFAKFAKYRGSRGLLVKLILVPQNSTKKGTSNTGVVSKDDGLMMFIPLKRANKMKTKIQNQSSGKKAEEEHFEHVGTLSESTNIEDNVCCHLAEEMKSKLILDLKKEILTEIKNSLGVSEYTKEEDATKQIDYEDDSEEILRNHPPEIRKLKRKAQKEKKEKSFEQQSLDSRLKQQFEKLELIKKGKLLEITPMRSPIGMSPINIEQEIEGPKIMSGIGKGGDSLVAWDVGTFAYVWTVTNDGTLPWSNVELRHTWSSPGLEPIALSVKCPRLYPGEKSKVRIKFKYPNGIGNYYMTYWHFFYEKHSQWQQFGHYLNLSVRTKSEELTASTGMATGTVEAANAAKDPNDLLNEPKLEQESKKHLEASLASAEIAADMAREAANAAIRTQTIYRMSITKKPGVWEDSVERTVKSYLPSTHSRSDSIINYEHQETCPGCFLLGKPKQKDMEQAVGHEPEKKLFNETVQVTDNNTPEVHPTNMTSVCNEQKANVAQIKKNEALEANNCVVEGNNPLKNTEFKQQTTARPLASFPMVDSRMKYPVFPPVVRPPSGIVEQSPQTILPQTYPYQNFSQTHQAFPPAAAPQMFPFPNMSTSNVYSQLPSYQQVVNSYRYPTVWPSTEVGNPNNMAPNQTFMPGYYRATPQRFQSSQTGSVPFNEPHKTLPQHMPQHVTSPSGNKYFVPNIVATSHYSIPSATNTAPSAPTANSSGDKVSSDIKTDPNQIPVTDAKTVQPEVKPPAVDSNKKSESVVQILPQALVDGAINVASSAYSTAWNALNNLRTTEGQVEFDPIFENNMAMLVEMGFNNLERNARLLKRFNNDISQVIGVICATGGAHNLDID